MMSALDTVDYRRQMMTTCPVCGKQDFCKERGVLFMGRYFDIGLTCPACLQWVKNLWDAF
jgi:hypothetical protein